MVTRGYIREHLDLYLQKKSLKLPWLPNRLDGILSLGVSTVQVTILFNTVSACLFVLAGTTQIFHLYNYFS